MKLDGREIGDPDKSREVVGENVVDVTLIALAPDGHSFHPLGPVLGGVLLKKELLINAARVAFEGQRIVGKVGQKHGSDARVVVNDLPFSKAGRGVENLVKVRQAEAFALDFDDLRLAHVCLRSKFLPGNAV